MNYGYVCEGWTREQKTELAGRLHAELKLRLGYSSAMPQHPYIEIDMLYDGVRIRRITNLSEDEQVALVKKADRIYREVEHEVRCAAVSG